MEYRLFFGRPKVALTWPEIADLLLVALPSAVNFVLVMTGMRQQPLLLDVHWHWHQKWSLNELSVVFDTSGPNHTVEARQQQEGHCLCPVPPQLELHASKPLVTPAF
ncbi:uncharacterized protein ARMOST_01138 [Armillaria ostoyae]|uniref:Uncharacterized protein n=1 Tax=Armillaria ostoyae TaxID=47428 RepID=A0A284QN37_ARMOS|nr:uncharacterized protein ARMOST_01138 [Armillaria ostoyae]